MHINRRRISLIFTGSELDRNNGKTLGFNETNFGVELEGLVDVMAHSEVDGGVGLVGEFKTVID